MCECGCGDFSCNKAIRVGKNILAVEIYPGCENCRTGLMVALHIFTPEEAEKWDIEEAKPFEPDEYGHAQIDLPLLGPDELIQAARYLKLDRKSIFGRTGYGNLVDFLDDHGLELLQCALRIKQQDIEAQR